MKDPLYAENTYRTEVIGNLVHIYAKNPLHDFYMYEYFTDNPNVKLEEFLVPGDVPEIRRDGTYVVSVVIRMVEEEELFGYIYLKSNYGDFIIPVNLDDDATDLVADTDLLDFGTIFAGEYS